jgi:hypothetical protein
MSIQSAATLKTYFQTGDFPTETQFGDLIDSSVNAWVDVRAYMDGLSGRPTLAAWEASPTTVDVTAAIQAAIHAAETSGGNIFFPAGTFLISAALYLDSTAPMLTYHIRGQGKQTILKPTGFTNSSFLKLNENSSAVKSVAYPRHPRLIIEDLQVDGVDSTAARFIYFNEASFIARNLSLANLEYGASGTGYTDNVTWENVYWEKQRTGGVMYKQSANGDGLVMKQIFGAFNGATECAIADITKNTGAVISGGVGGTYTFTESQGIAISGMHIEDSDATASKFTFKGSSGSIRDSYLWTKNGPAITVDDSATSEPHRSFVTVENCKQVLYQQTDADLLGALVYFASPKATSKVTLRNNVAELISSRISLWNHRPTGVTIDSDDATFLSDMAAYKGVLSGDVDIVYNGSLAKWVANPCGQGLLWAQSAIPTPDIYYCAGLATQVFSSLTAGTYYYAASVRTLIGESVASSEKSATVTDNIAVALNITNGSGLVVVRIWRGTSTGTYDRYVDVPVLSQKAVLLADTGSTVNGIPWIATGVPAVPTANVALRGTWDGVIKSAYSSAAPTAGTWVVGDRVFNTVPSIADPNWWECTTSGTPGTWTARGGISQGVSASQALAAGTALTATGEVAIFTCSGAVTSTAAPFVANGSPGQKIRILNVGTGTLTISDQGTLANSNTRLTGTTVAIAPRQSMELTFTTLPAKSVTSITSVTTTATVTATAHGWVNGQSVVISGATQTEYNGTYSITRTGADTFTYVFAGSATTPATGTILAIEAGTGDWVQTGLLVTTL